MAVQTHELKIERPYFTAVREGRKTFDVRYDDRGFEVGDLLKLWEINASGKRTGYSIVNRVSYILRDCLGLQPGYVVLGLVRVERTVLQALANSAAAGTVNGAHHD